MKKVSSIKPTNERGQPARTIYNGNQSLSLPGDIARYEGQPPTNDIVVNEAYDALGHAYKFFWEVYGRHSIDDEGMQLNATVHYGKNYQNAFWNGKALVIGDGDGQLFNRFSVSVDIVAKELAKGIIFFEAGLYYWGESGAVIESISDVFGVLVRQYLLRETANQTDWLIGKGLFTSNVNGIGLRSMKAPGTAFNDPILGTDRQVSHMRDFVQTDEDQGGMHINSGILNYVFYNVATEIGGYAWEKAGLIWYTALQEKLGKTTNFQEWSNFTYQTAAELFGKDSSEQQAVKSGWNKVGIYPLENRIAAESISKISKGRQKTNFGLLIEEYRRERGLSQLGLERLLWKNDYPVTNGLVSKYEVGQRNPSGKFIHAVAKVLALTEDQENALLQACLADYELQLLKSYAEVSK